jgi:hypothetical protein
MHGEGSDCFKVHRAPKGKFYKTRQAEAVCTRAGALFYFETEREALEFLADQRSRGALTEGESGAEGGIRPRAPPVF